MRLRRGSPCLRHADGDSHRNGEFHRVDLVEHDERCFLRRQYATAAASSAYLDPRLPPAAAVVAPPAAGLDAHVARSTLVGEHESAAVGVHGERVLDVAERVQQRYHGTPPHTRQEAHRHPGAVPAAAATTADSGFQLKLHGRGLRVGRKQRGHKALALHGLVGWHGLGELQPAPHARE